MFFQSHYFHRDRVVDRNSDNIFAECAQAEQQGKNLALHYMLFPSRMIF